MKIQTAGRNGFTLIELLTAVAVLALLIALAAPSFQDTIRRHRVKTTIESIMQDFDLARTEAIKRNTAIRVTFTFNAGGWCYGLHPDGTNCTCTNGAGCELDAGITKVTSSTQLPGTAIVAAGGFTTVAFDPRRGFPDIAVPTITVNSSTNASVTGSINVSALGRTSTCSEVTALGFPACPPAP